MLLAGSAGNLFTQGTEHQISSVWKSTMILTLNLGIRGRQKDDSVELEAGEVLVNLRQKFASEVKPSFIEEGFLERAVCGQSFREIRVDSELR